jgi:organic radical activating enzyme
MTNLKQMNFDLSPRPPKISQEFVSLEGEGNAIGQPSTYIRLAGCYSAACIFCDTKFSWGNAPGFKEIADPELTLKLMEDMKISTPKRVTITGGEPLHFMEWFPDIFGWVNSVSPVPLNFLGIESNGNLLSDEKKCMPLIKNFNEIIKTHGVIPTLTISPKIDAVTCYENQLTQSEVDKMYFDAFSNISKYLSMYPVYFKFIYQHSEYRGSCIDFDHQKQFIDYLLDELDIERKNIMLMPFTPEEPLEDDKIFWEASKDATARKALELGVTYSPRIHIDRKLD